jgi:hypothetical protein
MPGIGAGGIVGVALETVAGTYEAPTKFVPVDSESLNWVQDTTQRRPIRQSADVIGAVLGDGNVEGDISMEFLEDCVVYFLHCARTTVVKGGVGPNYTYAFKGSAVAIPPRTMSITVVRNGQVFAYVGCAVASFTISVEDSMVKFSASMLGRSEATQSLPTPTWPTTVPFGAGTYDLSIAAAPIADSDSFSFEVDDNGSAERRLRNTRGAAFVRYGERSVTVSMDRDFETRAEYDSFKSLTAQAISFTATKSANNKVIVDVPVGVREAYEVNLGGQGDLLRVSNSWFGAIDGTGNAYTVTVHTQENIT